MRVDLYTLIHKAQRLHLFHLSEEIGKADFTDEAEAARVASQTLHLLEHLKDHALNEEKYIHPLFQSLGNTAQKIEREHHSLESEITALEDIVRQKNWPELYGRYARFLGIYLLHLDEEESAQRNILWPNCSDEQLGAVFNRFKAERPPAAAKADFEFMLPALSISELTRMFQGMKAAAPAPIFQGACETASKMLQRERWEEVLRKIS